MSANPLVVSRRTFIGGLVIGALGVRALWRRWDLVERLSGDPDAYIITEVLEFATREATMERRQALATLIRSSGGARGPRCRPRRRRSRA